MEQVKKNTSSRGQVLGSVSTSVAARRHNQLDHGEELVLMSKCLTTMTKYFPQA